MDIHPVTASSEARWRPAVHFTAARGFINDPNGLILVDGRYHAFYQHNPHDKVHGPMHWGHAVSDDLVHWEELPIALYPDALGQCFSGSAVTMPDGDVAIIYTAHFERQEKEPLQTQCLVYANRALTSFTPEPNNPVLDNTESRKDFRDPKVFWHASSAAWIMVITLGRHIGIYRSSDLLVWTMASEFGHDLGAPGDGAWECPDLIEVPVADGGSRWVLIVGVWSGAAGGGSGTQYFLGDFDGYQYQHDIHSADIHWFDHGRDCYAVQSFSGHHCPEPRVIAWFSNWQYANETPTDDFRGSFTLPRDLDIVHTSKGHRIRQCIPEALKDAFVLIENDTIPSGAVYRVSRRISLKPGHGVEISLFGETEPHFTIERSTDELHWHLTLNRKSVLGDGSVLEAFGGSNIVELVTPVDDTLETELYVDHGLVELFLGGGIDVATMCFYPANPARSITIRYKECENDSATR